MATDTITIDDKRYVIRLLDEQDEEEVLDLFKKCPDYFQMVGQETVHMETVTNFMEALPPGKDYEDKYSMGVYLGSQLLGVVDLIKDFPQAGVWMLGLMLLEPDSRKKGLGQALHRYIKDFGQADGIHTLRVGVVIENTQALSFWQGLGYVEEKRTEEVIVLNLKV